MLWHMPCRLYRVVLWSVTIISYNIAKLVSFAGVPEYPIEDVFVFVRMIVSSLTGCTVFGQASFQLYQYCCTLRSVDY